ncbi:MAG: trypsin-like serine protease [Cocleimonas sp.]|nr:trypsin-like serine protease [Cocleimonas sp.]
MKNICHLSAIVLFSVLSTGVSIADEEGGSSGAEIATATSSVDIDTPAVQPQMESDVGEESQLDYANAVPMQLPQTLTLPTTLADALFNMSDDDPEMPGAESGGRGSEVLALEKKESINPEKKNTEAGSQNDDLEDYESQEHGTKNHPFSTSRVDAYGVRLSKYYPYRATGKLYFKKQRGGTRVCSAALIKKGVLLTAAHCVSKWGGGYYKSFRYQPAKFKNSLPYGGTWTAYSPLVMNSYKKGLSSYCSQNGVICKTDIAVLKVARKRFNGKLKYPGELTGWLGYSWNGYGFTNSRNLTLGSNLAQITQLGYPSSHDQGAKMQRNDSLGYKDSRNANNTIIGSRLTGGSSGGPWIVNFGSDSSLNKTKHGSESARNRVVGVTSWGSRNIGKKIQGASRFTSKNIVPLVKTICKNYSGC